MLIDELREQLKETEPTIKIIATYWHNAQREKRFQELEQLSQQENFWQRPEQANI